MEKFYDIHMHAFDLSHPSLTLFLKRFVSEIFSGESKGNKFPLFQAMKLPDEFEKVSNMLSIFENDIGSQFLILEYYIKNDPRLFDPETNKVNINGVLYDKIVLCPLMMDFGYKQSIGSKRNNELKSNITQPYRIIPSKSITKQTVDLFNGIRKYYTKDLFYDEEERMMTTRDLGHIEKTGKLFEIYPFMGINPLNYKPADIDNVLEKYFSKYEGLTSKFYDNLGTFNGDITTLGENTFAGIKLYPPLGFDPWPAVEKAERVKHLYQYCVDKDIPITVHCAEGGFFYESNNFSDPHNWEDILDLYRLRINFAHFGKKDDYNFLLDETWTLKIISYMKKYDKVYSDFSYSGVDILYYKRLKEYIYQHHILKERLLFGTDFMVDLQDINSYNDYLYNYSVTEDLSEAHKNRFATKNAKEFLRVR